jgi:hypothetical protein
MNESHGSGKKAVTFLLRNTGFRVPERILRIVSETGVSDMDQDRGKITDKVLAGGRRG